MLDGCWGGLLCWSRLFGACARCHRAVSGHPCAVEEPTGNDDYTSQGDPHDTKGDLWISGVAGEISDEPSQIAALACCLDSKDLRSEVERDSQNEKHSGEPKSLNVIVYAAREFDSQGK